MDLNFTANSILVTKESWAFRTSIASAKSPEVSSAFAIWIFSLVLKLSFVGRVLKKLIKTPFKLPINYIIFKKFLQ